MPITAVQVIPNSTWQVGNSLTWGISVTDAAGNAQNLGANPTAAVTLPDGTTPVAPAAVPVVTKTSTGRYQATYTATQAGRHRLLWTAGSGGADARLPYTDVLDVWPVDPRFILSLADARSALKWPDPDRIDDDDLLLYIAATTAVIEDITGPILAASKVETHDGYQCAGSALLLNAYPTTITSVVEDGVTVAATGYKAGQGGVLWRIGRDWSMASPGNIVVTYTVGTGTVPPNVTLAAREELRHLWQVGQVASRPALGGGDVNPGGWTPMGFAVPNRVIELLGDQVGRHQGLGVH